MSDYKKNREYIKAGDWRLWSDYETDQKKKLPFPPPMKPCPEGVRRIGLPGPHGLDLGTMPLAQAIVERESVRKFSDEGISLAELSFLLWVTQGVKKVTGGGARIYRTVPSAGCRHPFETYLMVSRVEGLEPGLYRYLSLDHELYLVREHYPEMADDLAVIASNQSFVGKGAVCFIWSAVPYRNEWRYAPLPLRMVAMDAGHLCQNLYLAATALGLGTCAIGAYDQARVDQFVGLDGDEEFVIYMAPVGRRP
jgi:SagB-type dehydrogenase family enzyme